MKKHHFEANKIRPNGFLHKSEENTALLRYLVAKNQPETGDEDAPQKRIVVIGRHKYYDLFTAQLIDYAPGPEGELRGPFVSIDPLALLWHAPHPDGLKFYAALAKFQGVYGKSPADAEALKSLIRNPSGYKFYYHDSQVSEKISARSLSPVTVSQPKIDLKVQISLGEKHYHIQSDLTLDGAFCPLSRIDLRFGYFVVLDAAWYLCDKPPILDAAGYFKRQSQPLLLTPDAFLEFQFDGTSRPGNPRAGGPQLPQTRHQSAAQERRLRRST